MKKMVYVKCLEYLVYSKYLMYYYYVYFLSLGFSFRGKYLFQLVEVEMEFIIVIKCLRVIES